MKEHGIIFKGPLVRAIMEGRKTQTRRVPSSANTLVDGPRMSAKRWEAMLWDWQTASVDKGPSPAGNPGPYLKMVREHAGPTVHRLYPKWRMGDVLWVRETHYRRGRWVKNGLTKMRRQQRWRFKATDVVGIRYVEHPPEMLGRKRGAGRSQWWKRPSIFMPRRASRLTLRVKRVWPERVQEISEEDAKAEGRGRQDDGGDGPPSYVAAFMDLWNEINGPRGWGGQLNRPVWCIEFEGKTR